MEKEEWLILTREERRGGREKGKMRKRERVSNCVIQKT